MSQDQFLQSDETQDAVLRRLTVIGEAVKNIPKAFRTKYPKIAWKEIAGLRDKLIHEYFGVDLKLTFEIATEDLPELKKKISNIVEDIDFRP